MEEGCGDCHEPPEPAAGVTGIEQMVECITCHDPHAAVRPNITMLGSRPDFPCEYCHGGVDPLLDSPTTSSARFEATLDGLRSQARERGLEGSERFDWMLDEARRLPEHTREGRGRSPPRVRTPPDQATHR